MRQETAGITRSFPCSRRGAHWAPDENMKEHSTERIRQSGRPMGAPTRWTISCRKAQIPKPNNPPWCFPCQKRHGGSLFLTTQILHCHVSFPASFQGAGLIFLSGLHQQIIQGNSKNIAESLDFSRINMPVSELYFGNGRL